MAKRRTRRQTREDELSIALSHNLIALEEGPKKKKWTIHDLASIRPLTQNQEEMFHAFFQGHHILAHGSAGTGKTFLSLFLACNEIVNPASVYKRIIIVRSAVTTRDVGFMPGTLEEKMAVYEIPYQDILGNLFGKAATYENMKKAGLVQFVSTSYIRGLTWENAIIIIDECQNMLLSEAHSVMTRVGKNSKVILCGDINQNDLVNKKDGKTGFPQVVDIIEEMPGFSIIHFTHEDIVRSGFVKNWIMAKDKLRY